MEEGIFPSVSGCLMNGARRNQFGHWSADNSPLDRAVGLSAFAPLLSPFPYSPSTLLHPLLSSVSMDR